jgi:hypothetical protein
VGENYKDEHKFNLCDENDELAKFYSMKFPKPKNLVAYTDMDLSQPELIRKFVHNYVQYIQKKVPTWTNIFQGP